MWCDIGVQPLLFLRGLCCLLFVLLRLMLLGLLVLLLLWGLLLHLDIIHREHPLFPS
jgi:hypothetical protein